MSHFEHSEHLAPSLKPDRPRVVVLSLASDFGCQVQLSNFPQLLESLSTIDLLYWQLVSSAEMPKDFDLAIIEGAVTTIEHEELLKEVRKVADTVIVIGACAATGGIPALVDDVSLAAQAVYGEHAGEIAKGRIAPKPVSSVVPVDYTIPGCPIDPEEFSAVLQGALLGVWERSQRETLCSHCKVAEIPCFYAVQAIEAATANDNKEESFAATAVPCLGLVTRTGCGALCVSRGRPCTGCRGIAEDANVESARNYVRSINRSVEEFDRALEIYNSASMRAALPGDAAVADSTSKSSH